MRCSEPKEIALVVRRITRRGNRVFLFEILFRLALQVVVHRQFPQFPRPTVSTSDEDVAEEDQQNDDQSPNANAHSQKQP